MENMKLDDETTSNLIEELTGANWNYTSTNVDIIYGDFINIIKSALEKIFPTQKVLKKQRPWFTHTILTAQKLRDNVYKKFSLTKTNNDWKEYKQRQNKILK